LRELLLLTYVTGALTFRIQKQSFFFKKSSSSDYDGICIFSL